MEKIHIVNLLIKHPKDNKILTIKRSSKDNIFGGMYALPGGEVEEDETTLDAARRELYEETGITLKEMEGTPIIVSPLHIGDKTYNLGVFLARIDNNNFSSQDKDISEVKYIEAGTLVKSLKENKYPIDQIEILANFFKNNNFT